MANNNPISICNGLNKLLNEILKFLSDERNISNVPIARSKVNILIDKLKIQSKVLAQMKEFSISCDGESYVEMKSQPTPTNMYVEFENPKDNIYSDIPENANVDTINNTPDIRNVKDICPYANRKYSDFTNYRKKGVLSKREKLLFFDTNRKYHGIIYENYFLLYLNETDGQATHALNLQQFLGRAVDENPKSFFLINKSTKITYIFYAMSQKDQLQWLAAMNSNRVTQASVPSNSHSITCSNNSLGNKANFKKHESKQSEEIYEMLEDEYDRVDNNHLAHLKKSRSSVKTGNKSLPKLPDLPTPPLRPKPKQVPIIIQPTASSDFDDEDDNSEANLKTVGTEHHEEDHYDVVCAPRLRINRPPSSVKARTADLASVHPCIVSNLNLRSKKPIDLSPSMNKHCSPSLEPTKSIRCSSDEYYDSIVDTGASSGIVQDRESVQLVEEDIYDRVVNTIPSQTMIIQSDTIHELKTRFKKIHHTVGVDTQNAIKSKGGDLKKPFISPVVKLEKTKYARRKYSFFKEASATKII